MIAIRKIAATAVFFAGVIIFSRASVRAEGLQIAPFYGFRTGQHFTNQLTGRQVDLDGSGSYGATVDVPFMKHGQFLEFLYSHQESKLSGGGVSPAIAARIDEWHGGLLQEYDHDQWKPFLVGLFGVTHFEFSSGYGSEDLFSMGLGGGVKYFPTAHVGFRLDARGFLSFVEGGGAIACSGGCVASYSGDVFWQFEVAPSVVISF